MFLLIEIPMYKKSQLAEAKNDSHIRHGAKWLSFYDGDVLRAKIARRDVYPGTFCERKSDGSIAMGYGSREVQLEDEFLHIAFNTDGSLVVQRDMQCTLPLFYGQTESMFVMSNDYREVVKRFQHLTLSAENLRKNLLTLNPAVPYTLWKEVKVLGERQSLWHKDGVTIPIPPAPRAWTYNANLTKTNPRSFPSIIKDRFEYFIKTRLSGNVIGFELSGGLDSAFLPLFMASHGYNSPAPAATSIQLHPEEKARQLRKIDALEAHTPLRSKRFTLDPRRHFPLAPMMQSGSLYPFDPMNDAYEAIMTEVVKHFQNLRVSVVVTGGGGDQLLEHRPHPSVARPNAQTKAKIPFLTEKCSIKQADDTTSSPPTLLSNSVVLENLVQANQYIDCGIWPVSPFNDIQLFNYCQALPIQFRANKNIFRAYFEAHNFPEILYKEDNEDYEYFFNTCMQSGVYDNLFKHLIGQSITGKLGYIDPVKLNSLYETIRKDSMDVDDAFPVYNWMETEINLRATPNWSLA
jgi:hypothetical protein